MASTYIDPKDDRYPIWGKLYLCKVPKVETVSKAYMHEYGTRVSGNRQIDAEMARTNMTTYLNVDKMVEFFARGVEVTILNKADVKTIYEDVERYLRKYRDRATNSIYTADIPFEDLMKLDAFSDAVFEYAKYQFDTQFVESMLAQRTQQAQKTFIDISKAIDDLAFGKVPEKAEIAKPEEPDTPKRESFSDVFAGFLNNRQRSTTWR